MAWGDIKNGRNTEIYKGFSITPGRVSSLDGTWPICAWIKREGSEKSGRNYLAKGQVPASTEEEAIARELEYARNVIDGAVPWASVADL